MRAETVACQCVLLQLKPVMVIRPQAALTQGYFILIEQLI